MKLILIYRPSEGGSLSRPRHCSQCATSAQICVSQWYSWKHKLLSAARFEPGPSRPRVGHGLDPSMDWIGLDWVRIL